MIIKKIIDLCKKSLICKIYKTRDGQFISNGSGFYPITGLPVFDEDTFCLTYDIPKGKIHFSEEGRLPEHIDISDNTDEEVECEILPVNLAYHSKCLIPVVTGTGIKFIDSKYLSPLSDNDNMLSIFERESELGGTYFVLKNGMLFSGIVMPFEVITVEFVAEVSRLAELCKVALDNKHNAGICGQESIFDKE